ncbi:hypothetical protein TYRP_015165 [Tyrophagus putrescentiae]|nr:hypothetical protein TYRP_015165 [Tyrophagus putrescentiae]
MATLLFIEKPPERLNLHDSGVYKQLYDEINGHVLMLFSDSNQISRMLLVIDDAWNLRPSLVGATTLNASITVFESPIRLPGAYDIEYVRIIGGGYMLKSVKSNL